MNCAYGSIMEREKEREAVAAASDRPVNVVNGKGWEEDDKNS